MKSLLFSLNPLCLLFLPDYNSAFCGYDFTMLHHKRLPLFIFSFITFLLTNLTCLSAYFSTLIFAHNYSSNNRILRYKWIDCYFFVDTFYIRKKKSLKSARSNTCYQLFVMDKGYLYVILIRKESEVLLAIKLFTKDLRVLEVMLLIHCKISEHFVLI